MAYNEKQKMALRKMGLTEDEIKQAELDDEAIDKGKRLDWEPSVEEEREMRKLTKPKTERKKTSVKREKIADETKLKIMELVAQALAEYDVSVANPETQLDFSVGTDTYSLKLTKHRAPKA